MKRRGIGMVGLGGLALLALGAASGRPAAVGSRDGSALAPVAGLASRAPSPAASATGRGGAGAAAQARPAAVAPAAAVSTAPVPPAPPVAPRIVASFANPVYPADFADPFILLADRTYYAYATNNGPNIQTLTSHDLIHWQPGPDALPVLPAWAAPGWTWAPAVLARPGGYVMYFAARDRASGKQCIGAAAAAAPAGPFVPLSASPFICQLPLGGSIDPSPFLDAAGVAHIVWKADSYPNPSSLWAAPLSADGRSLAGPPALLLRAEQPWEGNVIEAPDMIYVNGGYYLFFSANDWNSDRYSVGYAVCDTAAGPCHVAVNRAVFASAGTAAGPGGTQFFRDPGGRLWVVYHAWTAGRIGYGHGGARSLRVEHVAITPAGPVISGPTTSPVAY